MMKRNSKQVLGGSLVEILVAVALIAGLGLGLMTLLQSGAQVGARAGELQMASLVGSRVMDRFVALGFEGLERMIEERGAFGDVELATLDQFRRGRRGPGGLGGGPGPGGPGGFGGGPGGFGDPNRDDVVDPESAESLTLTVDGFLYKGRYLLTTLETGMTKITLNISWEHAGKSVGAKNGSIELVRLVADPLIGLSRPQGGA